MAGEAPTVIEPDKVLAPPSDEAVIDNDEGFIDLDAPLDEDAASDEAGESKAAETEPDPETPETADGEDGEPGEDADVLKALNGDKEPEKKKLSGSAKLKLRLAEAQAEIERLRTAVPKADDAGALASAVEAELGPAPKESDFEDYLQFQKAEIAYETAKTLIGREIRQRAHAAQQAVIQERAQALVDYQEREAAVRKVVPDYDEALAKVTVGPRSQDVAAAILESEQGPRIAYYLAKLPQKLAELNAMPVRQALKEIGRLEVRLAPVAPSKTKAPEPVPKVSGGVATKAKSLADMSDAEIDRLPMAQFEKLFAAEKARRGVAR